MFLYPQTGATNIPYKPKSVEVSQEFDTPIPYQKLSGDSSECVVFRVYDSVRLDRTFADVPFFSDIDYSSEASEDVNSERLALLAEKYVGKCWSVEMEARLQIDHKKIAKLFPRFDQEEINKIEELRHELKSDEDDVDRILEGLGIK